MMLCLPIRRQLLCGLSSYQSHEQGSCQVVACCFNNLIDFQYFTIQSACSEEFCLNYTIVSTTHVSSNWLLPYVFIKYKMPGIYFSFSFG